MSNEAKRERERGGHRDAYVEWEADVSVPIEFDGSREIQSGIRERPYIVIVAPSGASISNVTRGSCKVKLTAIRRYSSCSPPVLMVKAPNEEEACINKSRTNPSESAICICSLMTIVVHSTAAATDA